MTRSERELLIQRYLSGEMTSSEEGDFFLQVALDKELRHDLQAQKTVESAFRKDREAVASEHTGLRLKMAAMLAVTAPPSPAPPPTASLPNGSGLARVAGRLGFGPAQWLITAAVAIAVTVGSVLLIPSGDSDRAPAGSAQSAPVVQGAAPVQPGDAVAGEHLRGSSAAAVPPPVNLEVAPEAHPGSAMAPGLDAAGRALTNRKDLPRETSSVSHPAALRERRNGAGTAAVEEGNRGGGISDAEGADRPEKPKVDTLKLNARIRISPNSGNK